MEGSGPIRTRSDPAPGSTGVGLDLDDEVSEAERLEVLRSFGILDSGADAVFDALTKLAAQLCAAPMALISMVDVDREWFKSRFGLGICEASRADSFCSHALYSGDVMVVPDALEDPRFWDNPYVVGEPGIRFYAGAPLVTPDGYSLGTLCVMDTRPRTLTAQQTEQLLVLAEQVMGQLNFRRQANELAAEVAANRAAQVELAAQHRMLRGVLSHPDAVIYAKDLDGRFVMGNTALHDLFGFPDGALVGVLDADLMPDPALLREADRAVATTGQRQVFIERFTHRDGSLRTYRSTKFPLRDERGEIYAVAGVSTDITVQQANEDALRESERRWRQLFVASPVGIGLSDERGLFVAANAALCALLGRPEADVIGRSAIEFTHPDDLSTHRNATAIITNADHGVARIEKRYVQPDGTIRWAWLTVTHTPGPLGQTWTLAHVQDVTDRLATEHAVRDSEANLAAVAEVVKHIQAGGDARQTIVDAAALLADADVAVLFEPVEGRPAVQISAATVPLADLESLSLEVGVVSEVFASGESRFVDTAAALALRGVVVGSATPREWYLAPSRHAGVTASVLAIGWSRPLAGLDQRQLGAVTLLADHAGVALRQDALVRELQAHALTDQITQLPNRRSWETTLTQLIEVAGAQRSPLTVAVIDFDHFKAFNDSRGHAAGDLLLRDFADRASQRLLPGDVLARWGGEEFTVALPACGDAAAERILDRVRAAMPEEQTCSIGFATWLAGESAAELTARADVALYAAKNAGRNRVLRAVQPG